MHPATWLIASAVVSFLAVAFFVRPIPQRQSYHDFADQRRLIRGIPNTLDVLSNLPFLIIGICGLVVLLCRDVAVITSAERIATYAFFAGTVLIGIGSTIYHLRPNDRTLAYDRFGMTIAFMSFLAMVVHERFTGAAWLLPLLLLIGSASIAWWRIRDDLRFYGWVQFYPIVALLVLLETTPPRYTGEAAAMLAVVVAYGVAKAFEHHDRTVHDYVRGAVSGHTLKHLAAACAPLLVLIWIVMRHTLPG